MQILSRLQTATYLVVDLHVGHLDDDLFELVVLPGIRCALHHRESCIVVFVCCGSGDEPLVSLHI